MILETSILSSERLSSRCS